jgi:hypothetical protein
VVKLPYGTDLDGYLLVEHPEFLSQIIRLPRLPAGVPNAGSIPSMERAMFTLAEITPNASFILPEFNPDLGALILGVMDCYDNLVPGVSFELDPPDPGAVPYYGQWGEIAGSVTINGRGGFLDVEPGAYDWRFWDRAICALQTRIIVPLARSELKPHARMRLVAKTPIHQNRGYPHRPQPRRHATRATSATRSLR